MGSEYWAVVVLTPLSFASRECTLIYFPEIDPAILPVAEIMLSWVLEMSLSEGGLQSVKYLGVWFLFFFFEL